jgi:hypothetical protein
MTPDEQLHAVHQTLQEFVADHPHLATRPAGVLGILKDLETVEAFLTWCVTKGYLADIPGEAACIALAHLHWSASQDTILREWASEHPERVNQALEPGSAAAIERDIAFVRWEITKGYTDLKTGTRLLSSLQQTLERLDQK